MYRKLHTHKVLLRFLCCSVLSLCCSRRCLTEVTPRPARCYDFGVACYGKAENATLLRQVNSCYAQIKIAKHTSQSSLSVSLFLSQNVGQVKNRPTACQEGYENQSGASELVQSETQQSYLVCVRCPHVFHSHVVMVMDSNRLRQGKKKGSKNWCKSENANQTYREENNMGTQCVV